MDILNQSLGKIARDIPGATAVFYKQDLDFCCGGAKSLKTGLAEKGLDPTPIIEELKQLMERNTASEAFNEWSNDELIEHILDRYHDVHREQLPELIRLAQRVERVHGARPECPSGLWVELEKLLLTLEEHMEKEENILFPMISRKMDAMAKSPISAMRQEHSSQGDLLAVIDKLTNNITLPKGACNTWRALYLGLNTFKSDFMNHIHLENNILFERVENATL
jgi:regulator of cell morphogenesis and NO signaling